MVNQSAWPSSPNRGSLVVAIVQHVVNVAGSCIRIVHMRRYRSERNLIKLVFDLMNACSEYARFVVKRAPQEVHVRILCSLMLELRCTHVATGKSMTSSALDGQKVMPRPLCSHASTQPHAWPAIKVHGSSAYTVAHGLRGVFACTRHHKNLDFAQADATFQVSTKLTKLLWNREFAAAWPIVLQTQWPEALHPVVQHLQQRLRERVQDYICKAYTNVKVASACAMLGLSRDELLSGVTRPVTHWQAAHITVQMLQMET